MLSLLRRLFGLDAPTAPPSPALADADLAQVRATLHRIGLDPDAGELADVLWLAAQTVPSGAGRQRPSTSSTQAPDATPTPAPDRPQTLPVDAPDQPPPAPGAGTAQPAVKVLPSAGTSAGRRTGAPLRVPRAHPLPDALAIGRALRRLHRRVPSRTAQRLDEDGTAECYAEQRIAGHALLTPVLRPAGERWFELLLIIDTASSMLVWGPLLRELRRLLAYNGAFSRVRTVALATREPHAWLHAPGDPGRAPRISPGRLVAANGRRAVLVASDCVAPAWHTGSVLECLRPLAQGGPLAILQMLPARLWRETALGRGVPTRLAARAAGAATGGLIELDPEPRPVAPDWYAAAKGRPDLAVPVLTLEPAALREWSALLTGQARVALPGVHFGAASRFLTAAEVPAVRAPDASAVARRLQRFLASASAPARDLAGLVAAAPLTLDVMRLIQQTRLRDSGQTHLAEVFVSGLLRREPLLEQPDGEPFFDFHPGVREALLDLSSGAVSLQVLQQVSGLVAGHLGQALDFKALLELPGLPRALEALAGLARGLDDLNTRHFASIAATVLARLGGPYARVARALAAVGTGDLEVLAEFRSSAPAGPAADEGLAAPTGPMPFRDAFRNGSGEGPEMVWLPGGNFRMGSPEGVGSSDEHPAHAVRLGHYAVGKYPVTLGEFRRFAAATGYRTEAETSRGAWVRDQGQWGEKPDANWRKPYMEQDDRHPVVCVSWKDALAYCDWLGKETGQTYGLLTEAQWEHACRAGSEGAYCFGDDAARLGDHAWYSANANDGTHPVGGKLANAWGLHDLHGNAWEWCRDWYSEDYYARFTTPVGSAVRTDDLAPGAANGPHSGPYGDSQSARSAASGAAVAASGSAVAASSAAVAASSGGQPLAEDPSGPESGSSRVIRGGAWSVDAALCRSAYRAGRAPSGRNGDLGFRLSRTGPWHSYPITLVGAQSPKAPEPLAPAAKPRFAPYQVFHDPLEVAGQDGAESPIAAPEMVYLPGGTFRMGDEQGSSDEQPVHPVSVSAFALGRTPVTWGQYLRFCEATGSHWPTWLETGNECHLETGTNKYYAQIGVSREALDLPVVSIGWEDARAYCEWLSAQTGERYALPTEAQWEYACRAGSTTRWCCGDDTAGLDDYAWFSKNAGSRLHPVGQKLANAWGLYDMHGSVWEWCADWYATDYYQQLTDALAAAASSAERAASGGQRRASGWRRIAGALGFGAIDAAADASGNPAAVSGAQQPASENPRGPESGSHRVIRGGAWNSGAGVCRSAYRDDGHPSHRDGGLGFRLSRTV